MSWFIQKFDEFIDAFENPDDDRVPLWCAIVIIVVMVTLLSIVSLYAMSQAAVS